jgi:hypothetical protein
MVGKGEILIWTAHGTAAYVYIDSMPSPRPMKFECEFHDFQGLVGDLSAYSRVKVMGLRIPILILAWILILPTAVLFNFDRRIHLRMLANLCVYCSFSLAGLPFASKCPECGRART